MQFVSNYFKFWIMRVIIWHTGILYLKGRITYQCVACSMLRDTRIGLEIGYNHRIGYSISLCLLKLISVFVFQLSSCNTCPYPYSLLFHFSLDRPFHSHESAKRQRHISLRGQLIVFSRVLSIVPPILPTVHCWEIETEILLRPVQVPTNGLSSKRCTPLGSLY